MLLSHLSALSRLEILPFSSIKLALVATPNNVPVVSKRLTNKNDAIMEIIVISTAPIISNFKNTGLKLGG